MSLLGQGQLPTPSAEPQPALPPPPPSPSAILRGKIIFAICVGLFGVLILPTFYYLDRYDSTDRAPVIAIVASILGFIVYGSGRRKLATIAVMLLGLVLLVKPFVRPVIYDHYTLSLTSETHLYFLISGISMLVVFGWLLIAAFDPNHSPPADSKLLRIIAVVMLGAGIFGGYHFFGGPTIRDVIQQHQADGTAMRQKFFQFAKSLPEVGKVVPLQEKLTPPPVWHEDRLLENNIDIMTVEELWNPDESVKSRDLHLSSEITYAIRWTGPKNPLASYRMGDPAGEFGKRLSHTFQLPWLAAYRSGTTGIEVFVYDLRAGKIVTAVVVTGTTGDYVTDRKLVLEALAKTTGGTFDVK